MRHKNVYWLCLSAILLVTLGWAAVSVYAQTPQPQSGLPFEFFEHDQVTFTWEDARQSKTIVQVLNNTTTARTLVVTIGPLTAADGSSSDVANALKPKPPDLELPPGSSASIAVVAPDTDKPPKGTYSGFLYVSEASTNTAIHIRIAVVVPAEDAGAPEMIGGESPLPLVDTWKVQYVRCGPIPILYRACATANDYLPLDIGVDKGEAKALDPNKPLGYLTNAGNGIAAVSWTLPPQEHPDLQKRWIKLNFTGLDHPGDYSGKIDLLPDDKDKGVVNLTVAVTDFILWPLMAILAGIVAAILVQHILSVRRPIARLREDKEDTQTLKSDAEAYHYKIVDFERLHGEIGGRIDELGRKHGWSAATLDDADPEHKGIKESLKKLDEHVQRWATFGTELKALEAALNAINVDPSPEFKGEALRLLEGDPLAFQHLETGDNQTQPAAETLEARQLKVQKATKLASSWPGWVDRLKKAEAAFKDDDNVKKAALLLPTIAQQALFEVARVKTLLKESKDLDALEAAEMEKSLRMAEGLVSGLKAYAPPAEARLEKVEEGQPAPLTKIPEVDLSQLFPMPWLPYSMPSTMPATQAERLQVVRGVLRRSDALMFWLAVIAAVYSALTTLYFDGTFGTALDYVGAFAWGLGTKATVEVVYAAINRLVRVAD